MEHNQTQDSQKTKRQQIVRGLFIVLLAALVCFTCLIVKAYFEGTFDSVQSLQKYIGHYGALGPVFLTLFQVFQVVIPILPGFLGCAVGSIMFGPFLGFLCNYIGISGGSLLAFSLARKFGMPLVQEMFPQKKYRRWSAWASKSKSYTAFLFLAMLLPLFPDDFLCYLTGVSNMIGRRFTWIICLGKPWCILAYSLGFSLIQ